MKQSLLVFLICFCGIILTFMGVVGLASLLIQFLGLDIWIAIFSSAMITSFGMALGEYTIQKKLNRMIEKEKEGV